MDGSDDKEVPKKKKWTQAEGLAYGMALGRELKEKWLPKKDPKDFSTPKWLRYISKIGTVGWILIAIGILILYGYLASFV